MSNLVERLTDDEIAKMLRDCMANPAPALYAVRLLLLEVRARRRSPDIREEMARALEDAATMLSTAAHKTINLHPLLSRQLQDEERSARAALSKHMSEKT